MITSDSPTLRNHFNVDLSAYSQTKSASESKCFIGSSLAANHNLRSGSCTMSMMGKGRLEAFSDGVIAIIITIMVLEMKVPHGESFAALRPLLPVFLSYVLSFLYVGIYWNNHHHMLHATTRVTGSILWANLHLLFWLSLFPFAAGWMGQNHFALPPSAVYGFVLLMAGIAYLILQQAIIASQGPTSVLRKAIGRDWKGKVSMLLYVAGMASSVFSSWAAQTIYVFVAILWLIPDRRIEHALRQAES